MSDTLVAEYPVRVTRLDKLLWPEAGITKADFIQYMIEMSPYLIRHLRDRPLTVVRYPNGIRGKSFYQKNAPKDAPDWMRTFAVHAKGSRREIRYILANNMATLIWLANQACIELHPWYSKAENPDCPTNIAIDLDPSAPGFEKVRKAAFAVKEVLDDLGFPGYPKTSGATGLQIFVPLQNGFSFQDTRTVTEFVARYLAKTRPDLVTVERRVKNRGDKVYVDYLQHAPNKTLVSPYSPRPVPDARVSAPVTWEELEKGAVPEDFTIRTMPDRVKKMGDLFAPMEAPGVDISKVLRLIRSSSSGRQIRY